MNIFFSLRNRTWRMFCQTSSPKNRTGSRTSSNNTAKQTLARLPLTWWVTLEFWQQKAGLSCAVHEGYPLWNGRVDDLLWYETSLVMWVLCDACVCYKFKSVLILNVLCKSLFFPIILKWTVVFLMSLRRSSNLFYSAVFLFELPQINKYDANDCTNTASSCLFATCKSFCMAF